MVKRRKTSHKQFLFILLDFLNYSHSKIVSLCEVVSVCLLLATTKEYSFDSLQLLLYECLILKFCGSERKLEYRFEIKHKDPAYGRH